MVHDEVDKHHSWLLERWFNQSVQCEVDVNGCRLLRAKIVVFPPNVFGEEVAKRREDYLEEFPSFFE